MIDVSRRDVVKFGAAALGLSTLGGLPMANAASTVRPAPGFPTPRFVETNGISMGYYEKGEGLPVVFCHGFPELAYSWRYQLDAFAAAGYRVVLPDQRGYGLTDRPEAASSYTLVELCKDMAGLLDALGIDKAVFVGHDWGGGVVWMMPRMFPDRVAGVIGVNTPGFDPRPENQVERESLIVQSERFYQRTFQEPGAAEAVLSADVAKTFEFMMRRGGLWNVDTFKQLPEDSPERRMDLLTLLQRGDFEGEFLLSEVELNYYVESFEATGFTGGLNWYRAGFPTDAGMEMQWDIDVPCLYVGAEHDVILPPSSANGMERYVADLERYTVADSGHWTQQEQPEVFNDVALAWLARKFGA